MSVLGEVEGVVSTPEGPLEIAQEGIDRPELRQSGAGFATAGDHALMLGAHDLNGPEAPQPVGDHGGRGRDRARSEDRSLLVCEGLLAQVHELRLPVGRGLNRCDERDLVLRAAPDLPARALATQVGVVYLHSALELAGVLAFAHDLHELVLHEPGGLVANAQVAHEFERGDVVLGLGQQLHRQEPARFDQRCLATVITAVPSHEVGHRKSGLKLHSVHRHGSPPVSVNPSSAPQWVTA